MPVRNRDYDYPVSRYKCMNIFIRKTPNGPGKTNCILPKGHDGPCTNVRGENPIGPFVKNESYEKLKAELAALKGQITKLSKGMKSNVSETKLEK